MTVEQAHTKRLFACGTLQLEAAQMATFGWRLTGSNEALEGFELVPLEITDSPVIEISGKAHHTMARFTNRASDVVSGSVFRVTPEEIRKADDYEVAAVNRAAIVLRSGLRAWAFVDAQYARSDL